MFLVCRRRSTWLAPLLFLGLALDASGAARAQAAEVKSTKRAAVLETFAQADGQVYFALKLSPQLAPPPAAAHDVVVLFDTSASQIGDYRLRALSAMRAMLSALPADDRAALLAVDVNAVKLTQSLVSPSSDDMRRAVAALERRVPLGSTDMVQALETALAACLAGDAGRARSVVYIGDGFSTANLLSIETLQRLVRRLADNRVSFSSYAVGPRIDGELLGALANHTGGMLTTDDSLAANQGGRPADRQVGEKLASMARAAVIWPTSSNWPAAMKDVYPLRAPPLRFDRDSVLVGTMDSQAAETRQPLAVEVQGELAGKPVSLRWQATPEKSLPENAYLAKVVEAAALSQGGALPTVSGAALNELRRWTNIESRQIARLGQRALALGRVDDATQLADEAERLNPVNAEAARLRSAVARFGQAPSSDLLLKRTPAEAPTASALGDAGPAGEVQLLDEVDRQNRVLEGFLRTEVNAVVNQANSSITVDPEGAQEQLKLLLDKVQRAAELNPQTRAQLVGRVEVVLRSASRTAALKSEQELQRQQIVAAGEARERINRELFMGQQKVDQLMSRFNALMDEERYRDAEAMADMAKEIAPGRAELRGAELTARTVGFTADMAAVRDMRHKGVVDAAFQVELSLVPMADDPPILFPDPEVWQLLGERRKKFNAVDLTEHGPNETKILAELDEKTELDFSEQPLNDVIDYLRQRHGIEIQLDDKALADAGTGSDTPVSRSVKGVALRSALKLLLGDLDLTYVIRNEVLMITSKTEAENMLSTRVYPLADLVVPIPTAKMGGGLGSGMGGSMLGGGMGGMGGMGSRMGGMGMGGMGGMGMGGMGGMGMGGMGGMGGGGFFNIPDSR